MFVCAAKSPIKVRTESVIDPDKRRSDTHHLGDAFDAELTAYLAYTYTSREKSHTHCYALIPSGSSAVATLIIVITARASLAGSESKRRDDGYQEAHLPFYFLRPAVGERGVTWRRKHRPALSRWPWPSAGLCARNRSRCAVAPERDGCCHRTNRSAAFYWRLRQLIIGIHSRLRPDGFSSARARTEMSRTRF